MKRKIIIMHQTVTNHDAIGNDIELMYKILFKTYDCKIFADNPFNTNLVYLSKEELEETLKEKEAIIIYHHSVYWEKGEEILKKFKGKLIFRYHNITPPEFFEPYNNFHYAQCKLGREQTQRLAVNFKDALWIVDSNYNAQDICEYVEDNRIEVCPPFHKIEEWSRGVPKEDELKKLLENDLLNILFVGRIAPNKGHFMLLEIIKGYKNNYGSKVKLRIIGKFDDGLPGYNESIKSIIKREDLENNVEFIGEIDDSVLISYYLGSDIFLCMSEHEGFCVPLIEAQYFNLPIITKNSSAIAETVGKNQIVLEDNIKEYVAALHILDINKSYREFLRDNGRKNFFYRFAYSKIEEVFKKILKEKLYIEL